MRSQTISLGLGSNLGNPIQNLRQALFEIRNNALFEVLNVSSLYESDAQLPENSTADWNKSFLNAAVLCRIFKPTNPAEVLHEIKKIEAKIGRAESEKWAPRIIDIDILYWDSENYKSEEINIPHLKLLERPFALLPLLEVWPEISPDAKSDAKQATQLAWPDWVPGYIKKKPFNTQKSKRYFWPRLIGILNITKDSFSDGGRFLNVESLEQQCSQLIQQGADIIEIGAESTRPGASVISLEEEYENLNWALKELKLKTPVSLDCRRAAVIERILEGHRLDYINDVSGFADIKMQTILKKSGLSAFVMHSLSVPPLPGLNLDAEKNPCQQLTDWWRIRCQELILAGILEDKLIFDPGIGFGKSKLQNLYILQHLEQLNNIKNPIMIGHSRKSFLSLISDRPAKERDLETALITKDLNLAYVQYLRVHDVQSQLMALK